MITIFPSLLHRENNLFDDPFENLSVYLLKTSRAERKHQQIKDDFERMMQYSQSAPVLAICSRNVGASR